LYGEKQFSEFQNKQSFDFYASDAFLFKSFPESQSFRQGIYHDVAALGYLYDGFAGPGGAQVTSGAAYEAEVGKMLENIYTQIMDSASSQPPTVGIVSDTPAAPGPNAQDLSGGYDSGSVDQPSTSVTSGPNAQDGSGGYDSGSVDQPSTAVMSGPNAQDGSGGYDSGSVDQPSTSVTSGPNALDGSGGYDSGSENPPYEAGAIFYWQDSYSNNTVSFDTSKIFATPALIQGGVMKSYDSEGVSEAFAALFPEQIALIRQEIADARQQTYDFYSKQIAGTLYCVNGGGKALSNVELDANGLPKDINSITEPHTRIQIENKTVQMWNMSFSGDTLPLSDFTDGNATLYMSWPDGLIAARESLYDEAAGMVQGYFFTAIALAVLAVVFLVMSIVFTGRKRPAFENTRRLWAFDKIFVEFQIVLLFLLGAYGVYLSIGFLGSSYLNALTDYEFYLILAGCAGFVFSLAILWFLLSLVRVGKAGLFAKRSLICRLVTGPVMTLGAMIKSGYDGRNPLAKTIIFVVWLWFLTALFAGICGLAVGTRNGGAAVVFGVLMLLILAEALWFTRKWVERYGRLRKGVEEIGRGNLDYKIEITGDGKNEFDRLSALVNELGSAQNAAIESELKNQRLKTDLISNVSHDLKTPLTSIITYTDLLKTEGLESKNAEEYLAVIDEKGRRLQKLTEDLFDAAKASSGAIPVRRERVDMLALIRQEIAEMNGSLDAAGLELVIEAESEHYYVEADSQLLWRVVDNLLRNVRKYAQHGTRVYIELAEHTSTSIGNTGRDGMAQGGMAQGKVNADITRPITSSMTQPIAQRMTKLEIKNISAVKLNIPPEELMERFKRGDESRASEGSGLGLAIARDLVRLQGGWFELAIDGDLFKAVVTLPSFAGEQSEENEGPGLTESQS